MSDEQTQMDQLLEVEAAPIVAQAHPVRWIRENLFPSVLSGFLTVITALALIGFVYGILSWVFAPQVALVPEGVTTVDAFVHDIVVDDLVRTNRVEPDQLVAPGETFELSTTNIEWEVPEGVDTVQEFATFLLGAREVVGFVPTGTVIEGSDEIELERVTGLDPSEFITTAEDARNLNGLAPDAAIEPGSNLRVEGSARQWSSISTNSRNYSTLAYPQQNYNRVWISFGIISVLIGLSFAVWSDRPKASSARIARKLTIFGAVFTGFVLLAPWSFKVDLSFLLAGVVMAVGGFLLRRRMLVAHGEEVDDVPLLGLVAFFLALATGALWLLPVLVDKVVIARSTQVPLTVMALLAVGAFWLGKALRRVMKAEGALKLVLVGFWALSMPVIYMVILRNPALDFGARDVLTGIIVGLVGAAFVWFMTSAHAGEAGKAISGLLVLIALLVWAPFELFTVGVILFLAMVAALAWLVQAPSMDKGIVLAALVTATAIVWILMEGHTEIDPATGLETTTYLNPYLEMIKTKLLLGGLATFALAASTFGGNTRARISITGAWLGTAAVVTWFSIIGEGGTNLDIQSAFLGGIVLTFLLAFGGILLSFPIGVMLALGRTSTMPLFRVMSTAYIETVRGVPLITVLFFGALFLPLFLPSDLRIDDALKALIAITGFSGAYLAENVRGGLQSIPKGQYEASQALGMSTVQMTLFITLPQALRAVIPALVGQVIALFKDTSLVAIIGLADLLLVARAIVPGQPAFIGSQLENLLFVAIVYWIFTFSFSRASLRVERKLGLGER